VKSSDKAYRSRDVQ